MKTDMKMNISISITLDYAEFFMSVKCGLSVDSDKIQFELTGYNAFYIGVV